MNGCCAGRETDLPWGVVFQVRTEGVAAIARAVHPTQLYELILALLGVPLCLFIIKKRARKMADCSSATACGSA